MSVAQKIKDEFADQIDLQIFDNDSDYARACNIKASICLFLDQEKIPVKTALSYSKMKNLIREKLT